jgi:hypothetical protein
VGLVELELEVNDVDKRLDVELELDVDDNDVVGELTPLARE